MPNTKAAKKALRVSERRRAVNNVKRNKMTQARRVLNKLFANGKQKFSDFQGALSAYVSTLDKAAKNNVIPKQRADRLKSRITAKVKKATGEDQFETAGKKKEKVKTKKSSASTAKKATKTTAKKVETKAAPKKTATKATVAKKAPSAKKTSKKTEDK